MGLKVSRILHAGYVFEYKGAKIVFDPIFENPFSVNCYAFPDVEFDLAQLKKQTFDAVFISHYHDDHCSFESLNLIHRDTPIYLYCIHKELFDLIKRLGFKNVHSLEINKSVSVGEIEVTPHLALDPDVDAVVQIQAGNIHVLNVVDAWVDPTTIEKLKKWAPLDLVLWPFQPMREIEVLSPNQFKNDPVEIPHEWLDQLKILNPKNVIPSSCQFRHEEWSWYNKSLFPVSYKQFKQEISNSLPDANIFRLNPSESILVKKDSIEKSEPLSWVKILGDPNLDYEFDQELIAPTTASISKKFPSLGDDDSKMVKEFCQSGIISRFNHINKTNEEEVQISFNWQLSVFDSLGESLQYNYNVSERGLTLLSEQPQIIEWKSEISEFKIHSALYKGESLTSLYIRVICNADPMRDPLIRCLFEGVFGAYQMAQLERILKGR